VVHPNVRLAVQTRIPCREVGAELLEQLDGAVEGVGVCTAALFAALDDASLLVLPEPRVMVIQLDPVIPRRQAAEAHGYKVLVAERTVGEWFRRLNAPVWVGRRCRTDKGDRSPGARDA